MPPLDFVFLRESFSAELRHTVDMAAGPTSASPNPSVTPRELLSAWGNILTGKVPMLSIEITRECPLSCSGCYAYGPSHLGGQATLRQLSDLHGDALVNGILDLVCKHKPMHVSLVGGEPLVRHKEFSRMNIFSLVVTSAVIPIPAEWMNLRRVRVAVSIDGLPEHHDIRRQPATYERILKNIEGREINVHWTITRPMLGRSGYLEEYVAFWSARPEVDRIWVSVYTPQLGEEAPEILTPAEYCAWRVLARRPEPASMGLKDGPANGKSHAHTAGLRGVERVKDLVYCFGRDPCARIFNRCLHVVGISILGR